MKHTPYVYLYHIRGPPYQQNANFVGVLAANQERLFGRSVLRIAWGVSFVDQTNES